MVHDFLTSTMCGKGEVKSSRFLYTKKNSPCRLSPVRPLTTNLEHEPLVHMIAFGQVIIGKLVLGIVLFDEIQNDGTSLPESETCVGIFDD
jgi:hypothetical protein